MQTTLDVVIEKDADGYYAWCPALKGCQSQGDTFEETLANIQEAAELYWETLDENGRRSITARQLYHTSLTLDNA